MPNGSARANNGSRSGTKRTAVRCRVNVKTFGDYREMLQLPDLDAVVISTPDHWHAQPAIEAALAGKDIYLQKPASLTIAEGRLMSDVIHRTGCILQIGSQQRSMPQFRIACELVRNGYIGNVNNVIIGLPYDPSGEEEPEMAVPANLNYDMWLGETPRVYYTEKRVHPQNDYSRPGWLRCEQFGAGMITGWGAHHLDTMNWALGTEYTGPVEVEADAEFPKSGLWDVHGAFLVNGKFASGTTFQVSDKFPNGVKFEGDEGWIFVTRGNYAATASDPVTQSDNAKALDASDPKILSVKLKSSDFRLKVSEEQHKDWIESVISHRQPIAPAEVGHRACSACLVSHIAMKLDRKLSWDPAKGTVQQRRRGQQYAESSPALPLGHGFSGPVTRHFTTRVYRKIFVSLWLLEKLISHRATEYTGKDLSFRLCERLI